MNEKKHLKKIIDQNGTVILNNPSKLRLALISEDLGLEVYAMQLEIFLKITNISQILQEKNRILSIGKAGYRGLLQRVVEEAGFTWQMAEKLGEDLLEAIGYSKDFLKNIDIPIEKILNEIPIQDNSAIFSSEGDRGEEAYKCAIEWIKNDSTIDLRQNRLYLCSTNSKESVWSRKYLEIAYNDGYEPAYGLLGLFYYYGVGGNSNSEKALNCFLQKGTLTKSVYKEQIKQVINTLLDARKEQNCKRRNVILFSFIITIFMCITHIFVTHIFLFPLYIALIVVNFIFSVMCLFGKYGNNMKMRNLFSSIALAIWCAFILNICL